MLKHFTHLIFGLLLTQGAFAQANLDFEGNGSGSIAGWEYTCGAPELENEGVSAFSEWSIKVESGNTQGCIYAPVYYVFDTISYVNDLYVSVAAKSLGGVASLSLGKVNLDGDLTIINTDSTTAANWTILELGFVGSLEADEKLAIVLDAGMTVGPQAPEYALFDNVEMAWLLNVLNIKPGFSFNLSPNPAQDRISVKFSKKIPTPNIIVYNLLGIQINCPSFDQDSGTISVDVNDLREGTYLLQVVNEEQQRFTKRFIVSR